MHLFKSKDNVYLYKEPKKYNMAIQKIEHLGIAVSDLSLAEEIFSKLLGLKAYKEEKVEREGVKTVFFQIGDTKIELLGGLNEESPVSKFILKKGEGMHHIALDVNDLEEEMKRLQKEGFIFIYDQPKEGADNKLINFIHPKSTGGILVELCEEKK